MKYRLRLVSVTGVSKRTTVEAENERHARLTALIAFHRKNPGLRIKTIENQGVKDA